MSHSIQADDVLHLPGSEWSMDMHRPFFLFWHKLLTAVQLLCFKLSLLLLPLMLIPLKFSLFLGHLGKVCDGCIESLFMEARVIL